MFFRRVFFLETERSFSYVRGMPTVGQPFTIASFPKAVLHIDADAFFTSVEQVLNPGLRGKPVVTGQERGIIACASYEARALGVRRGVSLPEARKCCPALVVLPSDYETYSLYSRRLFTIMRRYTPCVEEYSIDEAFADITGARRLFRCSYEEIARRIQADIRAELGLTVSAGLSLSKSLAKLCSSFRKPSGLTAVPGKYIHILLQRTPLERVWGFGANTVNLLHHFGLRTAYDFAIRPQAWAAQLLHKPGRDIWNELRGHTVHDVDPRQQHVPRATILKSKTFAPPCTDRDVVFAELVRNVETAFARARRFGLRPRRMGLVLRRQDFRHDGIEARLNRATSSTLEVLPVVRDLFLRTFVPRLPYRATLVVLSHLEDDNTEQLDLFEDRVRIASFQRITRAVENLNHRYGRYALCSGTSLFLARKPEHPRDAKPQRHGMCFNGERGSRRLRLPRSTLAV